MKSDKFYLVYILECLERIKEFTEAGKDAFMVSHLIQDAVLRNLQTMAESTQRLSDAVKATPPHIPWEEISGFRNVLVHDYLGIDLEIVWDIMQHEIRELKTVIQAMLAGLSGDEG